MEREEREFICDRLCPRDLHARGFGQVSVIERRQLGMKARSDRTHRLFNVVARWIAGRIGLGCRAGTTVEQLAPSGVYGLAQQLEDQCTSLDYMAGDPQHGVIAIRECLPELIVRDTLQRGKHE